MSNSRTSATESNVVLQILGLDVCADTLVGDEMHRGVSGGQRKRVTTGMTPIRTSFCPASPEISELSS